MTPEFYRRMAQRCRELSNRTRDETARAQLRDWAEEFEAQAVEAEAQDTRNRQGQPRR
jgi:hypothetical protein